MALSPAGVLAGTPTASGSFAFDLQVTDSSGGTPATGTASYTLAVNAPTITLTPATMPGGTVDAAYSQALPATGRTATDPFTVTADRQDAAVGKGRCSTETDGGRRVNKTT